MENIFTAFKITDLYDQLEEPLFQLAQHMIRFEECNVKDLNRWVHY